MIYSRYEVFFEPFTERHFIKTFSKKYKNAWDITFQTLIEEFSQVDILFLRNTAEIIVNSGSISICKTEFKIAGTKESRHSSGNRCIISRHKDVNKVFVLIVYHKNNIVGDNETAWWKGLVKENYSDYADIL